MIARPGLRLLALAAALVVLAPGAAHAERLETTDAAGDVVGVGPSEQGGGDLDNLVPAPDNLTADVVRTTVDHTGSRLRVRVDLRQLGSSRVYFAVLRVRTAAGTFEVETENLARRPEADMTRGTRHVECRGLRAASDRAAARATVTIPTSCLDAPRWVQVGVGIAEVDTLATADGTEQIMAVADDAHRVGDIRDRIALGPKVRRG